VAFEGLKGLIDNTLEAVFSRKEPDAQALRKPLLKGIEQAQTQFENGSTKAPGRWWRVSNGVVALTVKVKGDTFDINGVATNHMPQERFVEFLSKFKTAVEAGEFDAELKNHGNGDATVHIAKADKPKRQRRQETPEEVAARTAKRMATIARKKAEAAGK
jgi:Tfp pilus assembly protein PilN